MISENLIGIKEAKHLFGGEEDSKQTVSRMVFSVHIVVFMFRVLKY